MKAFGKARLVQILAKVCGSNVEGVWQGWTRLAWSGSWRIDAAVKAIEWMMLLNPVEWMLLLDPVEWMWLHQSGAKIDVVLFIEAGWLNFPCSGNLPGTDFGDQLSGTQADLVKARLASSKIACLMATVPNQLQSAFLRVRCACRVAEVW
jgi:hypothetical protein